MTTVANLPTELAAEIAALPPFETYDYAVLAINGGLGGAGIRGKYLNRLYSAARSQNLSDQIVHNVSEQLQRQFDRAIQLNAKKVDANHGTHGWTSVLVDLLSPAEKESLQ